MVPYFEPVLSVVYFATGVGTVALGPTLPLFSSRWHMGDASAGLLMASQFAGGIAGALISTRMPRRGFALGCFITGAALLAVPVITRFWANVLFFLVGLGLSLIIASGNILAAQGVGTAPIKSLSRLHLAWGLGAVTCPWIFRAALEFSHPYYFFVLLGLSFLPLAAVALLQRPPRSASLIGNISGQRTRLSPRLRLWFALALFLYAGIENAISGWLPTYAGRISDGMRNLGRIDLQHQGALAAMAFTLLWGGVLTGRALLPVVLRYASEDRILSRTLISLVLCLIALIAIPGLIGNLQATLCVITAAYGLSMAGVYPILMGRLIRDSGGTRGIGWVLASTSVGGAVLPWLTGILSSYSDTLRIGFLIPATAALALVFLAPAIESSTSCSTFVTDDAGEQDPKFDAQ